MSITEKSSKTCDSIPPSHEKTPALGGSERIDDAILKMLQEQQEEMKKLKMQQQKQEEKIQQQEEKLKNPTVASSSDSHSTIPPGSKTGKTYQELEDEVLRLRTCAIEYERMFDDFFSKTPDAFRQYVRIKSERGVIGH